MRMARVTLDSDGRMVLPRDVLIALAAMPGDDLYFVIHGSHVFLTTLPEDYAPYLIEGPVPGSEFADRPSLPEDWEGWDEWDEGASR